MSQATQTTPQTTSKATKPAEAIVSLLDWRRAVGTVLGTTKGTGESRIKFDESSFLGAHQTLAEAYADCQENASAYRSYQIGTSGDTMSVRAVYLFALGVNTRKTASQIVRAHVNG